MGVTFGPDVETTIAEVSKSKKGHVRKPVAPTISLDQPGRLRLKHLMHLFQCSHTTIYTRMAQEAIPKPDGYDMQNRPKGKQGRPYWYTATILPLMVRKQ